MNPTPESQPVPSAQAQATVDEAVDLIRLRAQEKGVALTARVAPATPRRVVGDPGRLRQVLTNLLANAKNLAEARKEAEQALKEARAEADRATQR